MRRWLRLCICRRRMCYRRRLGPSICFCLIGAVSLLISIASFLYAFRHQLYDNFVKCSEKESLTYIQDYCQLYKEGKITGSLCQPLCETEQVKFSKCTDFHAGKRVDIVTCSDFCVSGETVSAVLKSSNDNLSTELNDHPHIPLEGLQVQNFTGHMGDIIQTMVKWELGFLPFSSDSDTDVLQRMWERNHAQYAHSLEEKRVAHRTIMMLMDQTEYKMVKALENSGIVPHIYGTCGPLYLQESCPSGVLDVPVISVAETKVAPPSWLQKAQAGIQLLQLIQRLEHGFPEVLHLCDVKGSNFGICKDGSVRLIDVDNAFFHTRMIETFKTSQCRTHEDCNFFDCGGWCMVETGKCYPVITNNNLQTLCRDVLTSELPSFLNWGALLSDAPASVASKLNAALQECLAQTSSENQIPIHKPALPVLDKLLRLLMQSQMEQL